MDKQIKVAQLIQERKLQIEGKLQEINQAIMEVIKTHPEMKEPLRPIYELAHAARYMVQDL